MTMSSPYAITLTLLDESVLRARARSSTAAHRDVIRARIVLRAAEGAANTEIAAEVGVHVDTVRKWRRRFATAGLPALEDRPRSGRRRGFTPVQVAEVKALACTLPAETGQPLSRWSSADLARRALNMGGSWDGSGAAEDAGTCPRLAELGPGGRRSTSTPPRQGPNGGK